MGKTKMELGKTRPIHVKKEQTMHCAQTYLLLSNLPPPSQSRNNNIFNCIEQWIDTTSNNWNFDIFHSTERDTCSNIAIIKV